MTTRKIGEARPDVANYLKGSSLIVIDDPYEQQHWELVWAHPEFGQDLAILLAEIEDLYVRGNEDENAPGRRDQIPSLMDLEMAAYDDESAPYPVILLAEKWGVAPAVLCRVLFGAPDSEFRDSTLRLMRREASSILVRETPSSFIIRVPRPLTPARRKGLKRWLDKGTREGRIERIFRATTRQRPSQALVEAIPWFERWVAGEPPNEIWQDVHSSDKGLTFEAFMVQLRRLWERMLKLSPQGVPTKGPSEKAGQGPQA